MNVISAREITAYRFLSIVKVIKYISVFLFVTVIIQVNLIFTIFTANLITITKYRSAREPMFPAGASVSTALILLGAIAVASN